MQTISVCCLTLQSKAESLADFQVPSPRASVMEERT